MQSTAMSATTSEYSTKRRAFFVADEAQSVETLMAYSIAPGGRAVHPFLLAFQQINAGSLIR